MAGNIPPMPHLPPSELCGDGLSNDSSTFPMDMETFAEYCQGPHTSLNDCNRTADRQPVITAYFVIVGVLIPVGLFFNVLSLVVFATSRKLRKTTTGHYLLALSTADILFLLGELIRWVNTENLLHLGVGINFLDRIDVVCKLTMCLRYGAKLASAWTTVAIMFERFLIVAFPLKVVVLSTPRIAKIAICTIFALSFLGGCFPLWCVGVVLDNAISTCSILSEYHHTYDKLNWVFLRTASLILPGVIIIVLCILVVIFLTRAKNTRERKLSMSKSVKRQGSRTSATIQKQLTSTLLAIAVSFVALRLPYTIAYYLHVHTSQVDGDCEGIDSYVALKMSDALVTVNYATNFFFYCICGSHFRRQLRHLFRGEAKFSMERSAGSQGSQHSSGTLPKGQPGHFSNKILPTKRGNKYMRGVSRQESKLSAV